MDNKLGLQTTVEIIYKSIEDVHALISTLEEQIKVGLTPAQSALKSFNGSSQKKSLR